MKRKNKLMERQEQEIEPIEDGEREKEMAVSSKNQSGLDRRRFLTAGMGAAAAAVITTSAPLAGAQQRKPGSGGGGGAGQGGAGNTQRVGISTTSPPFHEPEVIPARYYDGQSVLTARLDADLHTWRQVCNGTESRGDVSIYNRNIPGPTFVVDPGSRLRLTLYNNLPAKSPFSGDICVAHSHEGGTTQTAIAAPLPACFMHTNLHTHGLFVSPCSLDAKGNVHCGPYNVDGTNPPLMSSDDVLIDIYPRPDSPTLPPLKNEYCIYLPEFHDPGTYWYHSHLHGASGYQVGCGMGGALIIREPVGKEMVQPDMDKIWFMQEVVSGQTSNGYPAIYGNLAAPGGNPPQSTFYINGICKPTLQMVTGQTQRWRFINGTGTPRGLMKLRLVKLSDDPKFVVDDSKVVKFIPGNPPQLITPPASQNMLMYLIAADGLSFYGFPPQPVRQHLIAAGNRADLLVNIPKTPAAGDVGGQGKYVLLKDAFPTDATSVDSTVYVGASMQSAQILAYIEVYNSSSTVEDVIPKIIEGVRPRYLEAIAQNFYTRYGPNGKGSPGTPTVSFQNPGGNAGQFQLNGQYYDPKRIDIAAGLNTAEEWILENATGGNTHPFHIHVNPFQIKGRTIDFEVSEADLKAAGRTRLDPNNPCNWIWVDTVALPLKTATTPDARITIRTRFLVYQGEFVVHCHILVHEDVGMMLNVKICEEGDTTCALPVPAKGKGVPPCKNLPDYTPEAIACIDSTKPLTPCPGTPTPTTPKS